MLTLAFIAMTICIVTVVASAVLFCKTDKFKYLALAVGSGWAYYGSVMLYHAVWAAQKAAEAGGV